MIEVSGKPILRHIIDGFYAQGFRMFIIAAGYLGNRIVSYFQPALTSTYERTKVMSLRSGRTTDEAPDIPSDMEVWVVDTGENAHTGDRLAYLYNNGFLRTNFVLTYGDGVSDVQMADVIAHHECYSNFGFLKNRSRPLVTMTVVNPPARFGTVEFFDGMPDGLVRHFGEKQQQAWDWINAGFMYVDSLFIPEYLLHELGNYELEGRALFNLARDRRLLAYRHDGYWRCMDTRRDLEQIESDVKLADGRLPWRKDLK
jgi:glucose-1-phosphate cytidylyltransferase